MNYPVIAKLVFAPYVTANHFCYHEVKSKSRRLLITGNKPVSTVLTFLIQLLDNVC